MTKKKTTKRKTSKKTKTKAQKFIASRFATIVFPPEITIDQLGVTLKVPGFFSGKETTIPFSKISSININCPSIDYSTINIATIGAVPVKAYGFKKIEVEKMKKLILDKTKGAK